MPSSGDLSGSAGLEAVLELIHQLLSAGQLARAWETYSRNGKYRLSRVLLDQGKHEIAIELLGRFWTRRDEVGEAVSNTHDFENELIAFYSMHLFVTARLRTCLSVINSASKEQFGVPTCLRVRANVLAGRLREADAIYHMGFALDNSPYSKEWAAGLIGFYRDDDPACLYHFKESVKVSMLLSRTFLGFLLFDYINALIVFEEAAQALTEIEFLESQLVEEERILSVEPCLAYVKALTTTSQKALVQQRKSNAAREVFATATKKARRGGDRFFELLSGTQYLNTAATIQSDSSEDAKIVAHRLIEIMFELSEGDGSVSLPLYEKSACQALISYGRLVNDVNLIERAEARLNRILL